MSTDVITNGEHRFVFRVAGTRNSPRDLGKCDRCQLIVTRGEAEHRKMAPCIKRKAASA